MALTYRDIHKPNTQLPS